MTLYFRFGVLNTANPKKGGNFVRRGDATCRVSTKNGQIPHLRFAGIGYAGDFVTIVLDPGHPSEVSSGDGVQNGTTEVEMCWEVGLRLEKLISQDPHLRCVKTRYKLKELTTNKRRAEIANEAGAALMVRLHCDTGKGSGFTLYYPDRQGTAQGVTGPSRDVISESRVAAGEIQDGLTGILQTKLKANPIKGDSKTHIGSKQGALTGSIFSKVPTVTIEMVFLSNSNDAAFIKSPEGQDLLARGLYAGIKNYLKTRKS